MKRTIILALAAMLMTGCSLVGGNKNENANNNNPSGPAAEKETSSGKPAVGDTVVAKWSQNSFYEGTVESLTDTKAKIKWSDKSTPSDVDLSEVYAMPKYGTKAAVAAGDIVVAKTNASGSYWSGAQVKNAGGDVIEVVLTSGGKSANVGPDKVIKVSAVSAADLEKQMASGDFLEKAKSKSPTVPAGFKPKAGDQVLAEWASKSWYEGRVQKITGDKVTVAWKDQTKPSDVNIDSVLPLPTPGTARVPAVDQYVLIKPMGGSRWDYAQTISISGPTIEAKTASGQTRSMKAGEYLPLD